MLDDVDEAGFATMVAMCPAHSWLPPNHSLLRTPKELGQAADAPLG